MWTPRNDLLYPAGPCEGTFAFTGGSGFVFGQIFTCNTKLPSFQADTTEKGRKGTSQQDFFFFHTYDVASNPTISVLESEFVWRVKVVNSYQ